MRQTNIWGIPKLELEHMYINRIVESSSNVLRSSGPIAGVVALLLATFGTPLRSESNCSTAKLAHAGPVSPETKVSWTPATCKLVVQAYQQGQLVGEFGKRAGVPSGTVLIKQLTEGKTGQTELKIWVPNASSPSDAKLVTVQEKQ